MKSVKRAVFARQFVERLLKQRQMQPKQQVDEVTKENFLEVKSKEI